MAKINEIVEHVMAKETKKFQEQINQAQKEADAKMAETRKFLEDELVNRKAEIDIQTTKQYQIKKNSLGIEMRDRVLQKKQALLSAIFSAARQELDSITPEQFHTFLKEVLQQFVGEKDSSISLAMGEKTAHLMNREMIEGQDFAELEVEISDKLIPNSSGFIVSTKSAQYNFLFDSLIEDARTKLMIDVAKYFRSE